MAGACRVHRSAFSTIVNRVTINAAAFLALLLTPSVSLDGVQAALCSETQLSEATSLIDTQKSLVQGCLADLKQPTTTTTAWTSFINEDNLQDTAAEALCASENCVKALITAMENLPDCCSQSGSATTNLPRLADDLLHQCDVRDARQLASELEAEIAKLPDLKVQIKSVTSDSTGSASGSAGTPATIGGVNVIIDVKKRELMKSSGFAVSTNNNSASNTMGSATGDAPTLLPVSMLIVALCAALQLFL